jgi:low affinity Fe/Cu permease
MRIQQPQPVEPPHAAEGDWTQRPVLSRIAFKSADWTGSVEVGALVLTLFALWAVLGMLTEFPRWWELVMTVGVPAVSLLLLVVVQHTQSHANRATHLKLDELIRANDKAANAMMVVEDASSIDLERIKADFIGIATNGPTTVEEVGDAKSNPVE